MDKDIMKMVRGWFRRYEHYRQIARNAVRDTALDGQGMDYSGIRVQSTPTNASEGKIIRALSKQEEAEKICRVVENTKIVYRHDIRAMAIIDEVLSVGMSVEQHIIRNYSRSRPVYGSRSTLYAVQKEILEEAYAFAVDEGLI